MGLAALCLSAVPAGATSAPVPIAGSPIGASEATTPAGYWLAAADGGVFSYGAQFLGSAGGLKLNEPVAGIASTPNGGGYWLVGADGGYSPTGTPGSSARPGGLKLNEPVVGIASTPNGGGYWLVAADGGVFAYGDAQFAGAATNLKLNEPVVGIASTPNGGGYWLVAADGGVFAYGDAQFAGAATNLKLNEPVVGIASTPNGGGYWLVAADGGVFAYGDAQFAGAATNLKLNEPVVGIASTPNGGGYWLVAADGGVFAYGDAQFAGAATNLKLNEPVVGIAAPKVVLAVSGVSPADGPPAGGTTVVVSGRGFLDGERPSRSGRVATGVACRTTTSCTATTPPGTGSVDVTATTAAGTSATSAADRFTYRAIPAVSGVSPAGGSAVRGHRGHDHRHRIREWIHFRHLRGGGCIRRALPVDHELFGQLAAGSGHGDVTVTTAGGISATSRNDQTSPTARRSQQWNPTPDPRAEAQASPSAARVSSSATPPSTSVPRAPGSP